MEFFDAQDFADAVRPHFDPVARALAMEGPRVEGGWPSLLIEVRYDGPATALLLGWDVRESLFDCRIARLDRDGEVGAWEDHLSPNEILVVRGGRDRWVTADDVSDVDADAFAQAMAREAANLRDFCDDVLHGDWSIQPEVKAWHASVSSRW